MDLNKGLLTYIETEGIVQGTAFYLTFIGFALITMVISYLCGSINSSIIISKIFFKDDIRRHGSGNAGLTNMLRTYGALPAVFTFVGDILKTAVAVLFSGVLFGFWYYEGVSTGWGFCYMAALFAMLGHVFPIYYKFKGGKGVLSFFTAVIILSPIPALIAFLIFVIIVSITKYVSLGSVIAAALYPVVMKSYFALAFGGMGMPGIGTLSMIIAAVLIVWCHRGNLKRISEKTENKLSFKKKPKADSASVNSDEE